MKHFCCYLFFLIVSFPSYSKTTPLSIDHFVKHGDYLNLKLSPDGKHIAARFRDNGSVYLVFLNTETMEAVGGIKPDNSDIIHTVNWLNNERVVYEYAQKHHSLDLPIATGELFAVNIDGSQSEMIYGYRASDERTGSRISKRGNNYASQEILNLLENDEQNILIIEHPWSKMGDKFYDYRMRKPIVSRLNVYTGRKKKLEVLPHPGASALATKDGIVKFISWNDENNQSHSAYRNDEDAEWQDLSSVFNFDEQLRPLGLSEDESTVYLSGRFSEAKIHTLFALDLQTGSYSRVFPDHKTDIEGFILDENNIPAVGITYPDKSAYVYAKTKSKIKKVHTMLVDAFEGKTVDIASRTDDGKTLLVRVSSDRNPGEYYLFDRDTLSARFIWANRSWIDPTDMAHKAPFSFTTQDGTVLNGYLTLPIHETTHKPPLVVMIHGGPHQPGTRDFWSFDSEVQLLANNGYAVMQVNFRGSDGYGQTFIESGYGQWGGKMIDDIIDATQWTIKNGEVNADNVCVYGGSYGGYAALMSAVKAPQLFKCAVGYAGIYDLTYMFTESDIPNTWGGQAYLKEVLGTDEKLLREYSPAYHVDKIEANVMLIHGAKDRRTPEINAELLQKKLEERGKKAKFLRYRQSGHGVYNEESRKDLYQGLLEFLNENMQSNLSQTRT